MNREDKKTLCDLLRMGELTNQAQRNKLKELRRIEMKERLAATLEQWDLSELLEMVIDQTLTNDLPDIAQQMAATIAYLPGSAEYVVCKCDTMRQAERVKWFINTHIHTTYNEQQANCF